MSAPTILASFDFYDMREKTPDEIRYRLVRMVGAIDAAEELGLRVVIREHRNDLDDVSGFTVEAEVIPLND